MIVGLSIFLLVLSILDLYYFKVISTCIKYRTAMFVLNWISQINWPSFPFINNADVSVIRLFLLLKAMLLIKAKPKKKDYLIQHILRDKDLYKMLS